MTAIALDTTFTAPPPGGWKRLADHFPGALTPEYQAIYAETCPVGMATYMARYGVLAKTLDLAFIHGHLYVTPEPLFGPREMPKAPPGAAVWALSRIHPGVRRRTRAAAKTLHERPWRDVAQRWFSTECHQWHERDLAVQEVDPDGLTDADLAAHVRSCRALVVDGYRRHFELHGDDLLPVGRLIVRSAEWGIEPAVSTGAVDGLAMPFVASEPPDWMLVTGYDLDSLAWTELAGRRERDPSDAARGIPASDLHDLVPAEHHAELEMLVADAQLAVPLRNHNGRLTAAWPMGLLRRAMLAAGRRLGFDNPTYAVDLTVDELVAALGGSPAPSTEDPVEEAAARRLERARRSALAAPATIGPDFAIPPLRFLPHTLAEIGAAQLAASDHMFGTAGAVGIGSAPHTGRALVVTDPSTALEQVEPGDVVVTSATSPSWNAVLFHAGAIVTTTGGLVSHAGLMARELDIPAVLGDSTAMERFHTGDVVTVDPQRAVVVLSA